MDYRRRPGGYGCRGYFILCRHVCQLPAKGAYTVNLFSNTEEYGTYHYVGQIEANRED
jgi:hypothetical protein